MGDHDRAYEVIRSVFACIEKDQHLRQIMLQLKYSSKSIQWLLVSMVVPYQDWEMIENSKISSCFLKYIES